MTKQLHDFLSAPKITKARIVRIDEQIDDLRQMMLPGAIRYDKDKVQTSPQDPMLKYIARLSELEEKRKGLMDLYFEQQNLVIEAIDTITDVYVQQVMTKRYVSCKSWRDIISQMPFAERAVYTMHKKGIQALEVNFKSVQ